VCDHRTKKVSGVGSREPSKAGIFYKDMGMIYNIIEVDAHTQNTFVGQ